MNKSQAMSHAKRWLRDGSLTCGKWSWNFTHITMKDTSKELFVEVVETLNGWVVSNDIFYWSASFKGKRRKHYQTVACIPDLLSEITIDHCI